MITLIAAIDRNRALGFQGKLLFWLPNDLKRFKELTTGHTVIMGRHTFESLPKGALPNRRNVVLTSQSDLRFDGAETFPTLEAALASCDDEQVYIIGGASVYRQAIALADALNLTEIDAEAPQADAWFPPVEAAVWKEKSRELHTVDEKHPYSYAFVDYVRR
ncbi:MAG: dihydrofolate reductase [Prevotellaceae bacterium]|jgi:dihydrofolate reductase|nr:dihydrofolate reductase [Prevotellaceae bacterium]